MSDSKDGLTDAAVVRIIILVLLGVVAIAAKLNSLYGPGTVYHQPSEQLAQQRPNANVLAQRRRNAANARFDARMDEYIAELDQSRESAEPEVVPEQPAPTAVLPTQQVVQPNGEIPRVRELLVDGELPAILPALQGGTFSRTRTKDKQLELANNLMKCAAYSQLREAIEDEYLYGADANVWRDVGQQFSDGSFAYLSSSNLGASKAPYLYEQASEAINNEFSGLVEAQDGPGTRKFLRSNDEFCLLTYAIIASASN